MLQTLRDNSAASNGIYYICAPLSVVITIRVMTNSALTAGTKA